MSMKYYFAYLKQVDDILLIKATDRYDQLGDNSSGTQL
jgi:hypothetical protein